VNVVGFTGKVVSFCLNVEGFYSDVVRKTDKVEAFTLKI